MRKIFLLLIVVVAFNCSSDEDYDSIKIEKPTEVVSTDTKKNNLLESELIYKVILENPDSGLNISYSEAYLNSFKDITNPETIRLINILQGRAIRDKEYLHGPPFLHLIIKNDLNSGRKENYFINKTNKETFNFYYFRNGFNGCNVSRDEINKLIALLQKDNLIEKGNVVRARSKS